MTHLLTDYTSLLSASFSSRYAIGRQIVQIVLPSPVILSFACVLQVCIHHSHNGGARKRRGSSSLIQNTITGMGGQIAVLLWLRRMGFRARMMPPTLFSDPGFDIVCFGEDQLTVEVKTSSPNDGRTVEAFTRGDRMPLNASATRFPDFYAWTVARSSQPAGGLMTFDLLSIFPAGIVKPWAKPVSAPPGIRLADVDPMFSPSWFVNRFREVLDDDVPDTFLSPELIPSRAIRWGEENGILVQKTSDDYLTSEILSQADYLMERLVSIRS